MYERDVTTLERLRAADAVRRTPLERAAARARLFIKVNRHSWQRDLKRAYRGGVTTDRQLRRFRLRTGDVQKALRADVRPLAADRVADERQSGVLRLEAGVGVIDVAHAPPAFS